MKKYILMNRIAYILFGIGTLFSFSEYFFSFPFPVYDYDNSHPYFISTILSYVFFALCMLIINLTIPSLVFYFYKKGITTRILYFLMFLSCSINGMFFGFYIFASSAMKMQIYNYLHIALLNNGFLSVLHTMTYSFIPFMVSNLLFVIASIFLLSQQNRIK